MGGCPLLSSCIGAPWRRCAPGSSRRARDQLELARLTTDDRDLLARIDLSLAYVDAETGDVDAGVASVPGAGVQRSGSRT